MSLKITDECIACDACREECPNGAISENDPVYIIDADFCTECVGSFSEPQCIEVCPVECIELDDNNCETALELSLKYKQLQDGK